MKLKIIKNVQNGRELKVALVKIICVDSVDINLAS